MEVIHIQLMLVTSLFFFFKKKSKINSFQPADDELVTAGIGGLSTDFFRDAGKYLMNCCRS